MQIKKFNENWMEQEEPLQAEIEAISNVLNDTGAYNKIGEVLNMEIDHDSEIFREIEEFILEKYNEMNYDNKMSEENSEEDDEDPGYDMSSPSI
jgi:hypothetical protein